MGKIKYSIPSWVRIVNVVIGIFFLFFAVSMVLYSEIVEANFQFYLSFNLGLLGLSKLVNITFHAKISKKLVIADLLIGVLAIAASLFLVLNLELVFTTYIILFAGVFLVQGMYRMINAFKNIKLSKWSRFLNGLIGFVLIVIFPLIFVYRSETGILLNYLLAGLLLISSLGRIAIGFGGYLKK